MKKFFFEMIQKNEICGTLRRQIFNINNSRSQLKTEEKNLSTLTTVSKDPCLQKQLFQEVLENRCS